MSSCVTITERSISAGSRPIASQCSSSTRLLWAITSGAPNACQVEAHCATSRSMTFSPPPPISTGIVPRTGGGLSLPRRSWITGSASRNAARRVIAVPNS